MAQDYRTGMARHAPTPTRQFGKPVAGSLPAIVGAFKSASTRSVNQYRQSPGSPLWQRNYYEHIIRDDSSLHGIRECIASNPVNWQHDKLNDAERRAEPIAPFA